MPQPGDAEYVLGTSEAEQRRLAAQGDAIGPLTRRFFEQAGIAKGMRVLDIGCGAGDTSILTARMVGPGGEVVGVDREPASLENARRRVRELGLSHVSFLEADFRELEPDMGLFDAIVGRLVLMYQADPAEAVRRVVQKLRPGGVVVFVEYDSTIKPASLAPTPLLNQIGAWIWETLRRSGAETQMGMKLYATLIAAGLPAPTVGAEAIVQTASTNYPGVPLVRVLLPKMVQFGIATEEEVDIDTLQQRVADELEASGPQIGQVIFSAWTRRPEA